MDMKRMALCMLAVLLVATFPVPGAADQLPGVFSGNMISRFANASCGTASATQPRFVGGVQTNAGNITIFVDFANSIPTPVVNPVLGNGNCTTATAQISGASFDVCYFTAITANQVFIATITDTNHNGRIDGGEGFLSADFIAHGAALGHIVLRAPADGACGGTLEFDSGFTRR
jgi:hypothetical protein